MASARPPKPKRPTFEKEFTAAKRTEFLDLLRQGSRRGAAVDVIFGSDNARRRRQLREYIDGHPEFAQDVMHAELDATEHVEEALYQSAVSGSVPAAKAWLELQGRDFPEHRGRPPGPAPQSAEDPFAALDNVATLDPRRRRARGDE